MKFATKLVLGAATGAVAYGVARAIVKSVKDGTPIEEQAAKAAAQTQAAVTTLVDQVVAAADQALTRADELLTRAAASKPDGPTA